MELSVDYLKHLLHYNPETGEWLWQNPTKPNTRLKGLKAGNRRHDGYLLIRIRGRTYYSGRLAFFYMTGRWPEKEIDHIDRDPSNDRWVNLREATSAQNKYNRTTSGMVGIYRSGNDTWWAMAGNEYLGTFQTMEEAVAARAAKISELGHAEFANLNAGD